MTENHCRVAKLVGGGSAGSPTAVTYAEESPPSTLKSVPYKRRNILESQIIDTELAEPTVT